MPDNKPDSDADPSHERGTVVEPTGSPFPDPTASKREQNVEVVPGQPMPSADAPDNGGVRAVRHEAKKTS